MWLLDLEEPELRSPGGSQEAKPPGSPYFTASEPEQAPRCFSKVGCLPPKGAPGSGSCGSAPGPGAPGRPELWLPIILLVLYRGDQPHSRAASLSPRHVPGPLRLLLTQASTAREAAPQELL